jgi:hypothetical protein
MEIRRSVFGLRSVRMRNTLRQVFPQFMACPFTLPSFHRRNANFLATADPEWPIDSFVQKLELSELDLRCLSPSFARGVFFLPTSVTRADEIHPEILADCNMIASELF